MKKIRVQVQGGLGNQLFIWAMAHEIAISTQKKVELVYVLDQNQRVDRPNELIEISNHCNHNISLKDSYLWGYTFKIIDKSQQLGIKFQEFIETVLKIHSCSTENEIPAKKTFNRRMIRGYFQNADIVNLQKSIIHQELISTLNNMHTRHSCLQTIHIRRGDTIDIASSWGVLTEGYYEQLIVESEPMIICTDSQEVADTFANKYPSVESSTPLTDTAWQTLKILSQGNRFIGANSTLSWWAAWLVTYKQDGVAILPKPWRPGDTGSPNFLHLERVTYQEADFEKTGI